MNGKNYEKKDFIFDIKYLILYSYLKFEKHENNGF